ncbi:ABC transporter ATP-binding protein [Planosporangium flavigriseum]|uniref:Dipeptide/oligopeptide/nickel ABC transporter ATP-binding protein n=1 Tax=Planosporangium flavigriseum TaxID=373681 RepID=A0A8J3PNM5_9ACTN|nr:ABC transporter ATP-binding protein [Planosporangium flavigriseum]NJC63142.1 ABC transporter ATP-binding protein [Planosporangium flavigriseum]GIG76756.1 dipeptide/oligopeptide/nickel ABC transporter ATP-binding protein [Planosporangium flavigriseum]
MSVELSDSTLGGGSPANGVAPSGGALVEVKGLAVRLPTGPKDSVQAVRSVNLTIRPGERVGIVGESGSGKSITGRTIAGLLPESKRVQVAGSVTFRGKEMIGAPAKEWRDIRSRRVSMIFQDPLSFLNPTMRVGRQVQEACRREGSASRQEIRDEVYSFMELAGLAQPAEVARKFPFELSGGMRQRVLIAIALAKRPELIIADEPTTALDVTVQARVLASLKRSVDELGMSLLMISHDLAVVAGLCDRVYVMCDGAVVEEGDTHSVFTEPKEAYTQGLLRSVRSLSSPTGELYADSERQSSSRGGA